MLNVRLIKYPVNICEYIDDLTMQDIKESNYF